jgi:ribonuclease/clavin/mitogillin
VHVSHCVLKDMSKYLETCRKIIALNPRAIIPAHGPLCYESIALMNHYISHRMEREKSILECVDRGLKTPQEIVAVVYASTPRNLWPAAMSNISLHLKKIQQDRSHL